MYNRQLYTFIKVADSGSFKKAAEELYISNVSVMKQMNALEAHFGFQLFDRSNHGITLTPAGRSIYQDAIKIMQASEEAIKRAGKLSLSSLSTIHIGTSVLRPCKRLIDLCNSAGKEMENFQIQIVPFDDNPSSMKSMMESFGNRIDCFVSPCDSNTWRAQYNILPLEQMPCRIALSRSHRLANQKSLTWNDLSDETFYIIEQGDSPILNAMRSEIESHPDIHLKDIRNF
jgi:DNA-binding transcriptional LysR family regulator